MLGSAQQQAAGAAAQPNADQKTGLREIEGLNAEIAMIKAKVGEKEREVRAFEKHISIVQAVFVCICSRVRKCGM